MAYPMKASNPGGTSGLGQEVQGIQVPDQENKTEGPRV